MVEQLFLAIFFFGFPALIIVMCRRWSILKKIGSIVLAYGFGLILGSSGILPAGSDAYKKELKGKACLPHKEMQELLEKNIIAPGDARANRVAFIQDIVQSVSVPLAFPLLLFSLNIRRWLKLAGKGFVSVVLALVSGVVMVTAGYFIFKDTLPDSWKLAGMFVGIYTGGSPNFAALATALEVDANQFILASTYDMIIGAGLVLFFVSVAPRIFRFILPPFKNNITQHETSEIDAPSEDLENFSGIFTRQKFLPLLGALGISVLIFAISFGLSLVLKNIPQMVVVILTITTLGIIASLFKFINRIDKTFQLGMYLIMVFSLSLASMADLKTMFSFNVLNLVLFITWVYFGSLILHLILAWIFRVDSDNFLITATAFVFSPPFVPMVANALKNKDLIVTGITGGILGYILGNYFGVALAYFLKAF